MSKTIPHRHFQHARPCFSSLVPTFSALQPIVPAYVRSASTSGYSHVTQSLETSSTRPEVHPLAKLPLSSILRSYLIMSMSSSPLLLNSMSRMLRQMLGAQSSVFDLDRNPILAIIVRRTFYDQFCAGEDNLQIQKTVKQLHDTGYDGVILEYAAEVMEDDAATVTAEEDLKTISLWKDGLLKTVQMANVGDFVGLKWSGMGIGALRRLKQGLPPSQAMSDAMTALCDAASTKGVMLLPAAEPQYAQSEVDQWTLALAAKYNKLAPGHAVIYNTYQCYLKSTPKTLAGHLAQAVEQGFTLGIKLVRGAYLETEQRDLIWNTKEQTHATYDTIAKHLLQRRYGFEAEAAMGDESSAFPNINVMLATHNDASVKKARNVRNRQDQSVRDLVPLAYAQLQGMADEVSTKLLVKDDAPSVELQGAIQAERPRVFKCTTWGTSKQCLNYLLRRAAENRDAMGRTRETRQAMGAELRRRLSASLRLFGT